MSATSDERREVAARLRFCARETNGTRDFAMFLNHWVGVDNANVGGRFSVESDRRTAEMTLEKLADLIDPKCEVVGITIDRGLYYPTVWHYRLSCGHTYDSEGQELPDYCSRCGARVVSDDE